jgi:uncharacterized protein
MEKRCSNRNPRADWASQSPTMKRTIASMLALFFSVTFAAQGDISPEKRAEIEKMLRLSGMEKVIGQMQNQMITAFKGQMPQVPELFWTKFQQKMNTHELVEKIIPIYDKYYTVEDIKAINAFYETPTGQKLLSTLPAAMQEAMKVGQEWGQRIGRQAAEEAQQELKQKSRTKS